MIDRRGFIKAAALLGNSALFGSPALFAAEQEPFDKKQFAFMRDMLENPSPTGYEKPVQKIWMDFVKNFAEVRKDQHGNTIGTVNAAGSPRLMFAGHCDEIGFIVNYIDDAGFIYFAAMGGFDQSIIPGRRVVIYTSNGPVPGVIGKGPIHLMSDADRSRPSTINDLCIDIGAKTKSETESLVAVGDPITYTYEFMELRNGLAVARGFDDRIGSFIVASALQNLSRSKNLKAAVHGVSTVQEEIGLRGAQTSAFGTDPTVAIAVDVTHATDYPGMDKKRAGDVTLGGGAAIARGPHINPRVFDLLVETAKAKGIPYQVEANPSRTGTDTDVIQVTRAGVATGLVSIPLRYMHTPVETLALADVQSIIRLLTGFAEALTAETDFTP